MKIWIIPLTCLVGSIIVAVPAFRLLQIVEQDPEIDTIYYLSIRVEDVSVDQISEHVHRIDHALRFSSKWVEPYIRDALAEYPGGTLFFYNTSEEQWKRLGGEAGYAILPDRRVAWKRRIAIS